MYSSKLGDLGNLTKFWKKFFFRSSITPKMTDRKAVIKNADMSEDMQQDAVDCATQAIEKYNIEKVSFFQFFSVISICSSA